MLKKRDVNKIIKMHKKKIPIRKIAKAIRASPTTVMAHIKKWKQNIQQNEATIQEQANDVNSEEAISKEKSIELKRIPPLKDPNDIWLRAFLDYYDFNKDFIALQIQKMKKSLNILPSVSKLDDDINRMDSGVNKLRWKTHISKVYEEYLSAKNIRYAFPSTISSPYIIPYLGSNPLVKPDTQKTTVEKAIIPKGDTSEKPVPFTQRKETAPVKKDSAIKESAGSTQTKDASVNSDIQKDTPSGNPVPGSNPVNSDASVAATSKSEGGSLWPVGVAILGGIAIGGVLIDRHLKEQKKTQALPPIQEGKKVMICPQCKKECIYDETCTEFSCLHCNTYLYVTYCMRCQMDIVCTQLNCCCPFCGVKLLISNSDSKNKTNYGNTILA